MVVFLLLVAVGFVLLVFGADFLVDGACRVTARFGVPDRVAGLTIVATGTSLPELVVGLGSVAGGHAEMAYGNVMGSCMANLLLILGLSAALATVSLSHRTQRFEVPASAAAALLVLALSNTGGGLEAWEGALLLALFAAFIGSTAYEGLREREEEGEIAGGQEDGGPASLVYRLPDLVPVNLAAVAVGVVLLKYGADLVVDNASAIALSFGVSERLVGLTVVAVGTSLPELVTSVSAALKGNTDVAVGNVVGSNIANLLLVMGGPALLATIPYDPVYNLDLLLLAVMSAVLVVITFVGRRHEMGRLAGVVFVMLYVAYVALSVVR